MESLFIEPKLLDAWNNRRGALSVLFDIFHWLTLIGRRLYFNHVLGFTKVSAVWNWADFHFVSSVLLIFKLDVVDVANSKGSNVQSHYCKSAVSCLMYFLNEPVH